MQLSGATAGLCQVIATNPMEMVKIQMQIAGVSSSPSSSPTPLPTSPSPTAPLTSAPPTSTPTQPTRPSAVAIVRSLGLRGLYRHTGATLARDVPFSLVFFPALSWCKEMGPKDAKGNPTFANVFWSGVVAGSVAAASVTPMDVKSYETREYELYSRVLDHV
ncbi:hypothetical protein HDV00_012526 [Rhizophlyctis rosea]|nr:hypothetical protein HDV00_012526 [Rhizophlyctis rosea]